jgi:hypothetical protein
MEDVELEDRSYGLTSLGVLVELSLSPTSRSFPLADLTETQDPVMLLASSQDAADTHRDVRAARVL